MDWQEDTTYTFTVDRESDNRSSVSVYDPRGDVSHTLGTIEPPGA
ncbi:MAG: hypothetical protein ACJAZO_004022 [Myxococcota bacterium]|jgi:hypothetical protein